MPTFIDNGILLTESCDIIEYIDKKYPDPKLRPGDHRKLSFMGDWLVRADKSQPDLKLLSHEFLFRPRKQMPVKELDAFSMSHRNNDLVLCIKEWQTNKVFAKEKIEAAVTRTDTNFTKLNVTLKNNERLLGDQFSIAVLLGFRIFTGCI